MRTHSEQEMQAVQDIVDRQGVVESLAMWVAAAVEAGERTPGLEGDDVMFLAGSVEKLVRAATLPEVPRNYFHARKG